MNKLPIKLPLNLLSSGGVEGILLTLFRMTVGFFIIRITSDILGPAGLVNFSNYINLLTVVLIFLCNPLSIVSTNFYSISKNYLGNRDIVKALKWIVLLSFPLITLSTFILTKYINLSTPEFICIVILGLFFPINSALGGALNGMKMQRHHLIFGSIALLLLFIWNWGLILHYKNKGPLIAYATHGFILALPLFFAFLKANRERNHSYLPKLKFIKKYKNIILISVWSGLVINFTPYILRNLLLYALAMEDVGNWQAAQRFSDTFVQLVAAVINFSLISKYSNVSVKSASVIVDIKYAIFILIPFLVSIFIFSDYISQLIFGSKFNSGYLIRSQTVVDLVRSLYLIISAFLIARGNYRVQILIDSFFMAFSILLVLLLPKYFSIYSAQIALFFGYILAILSFLFIHFTKAKGFFKL
jgi:O-antigen/teichoic acid export membrane protein